MAYIDGERHYCLTEPLTRFMINEHLDNLTNKDKVLNLQLEKSQLLAKISDLEAVAVQDSTIKKEQENIIEVVDEQRELTKKELRRQKRKAVADWFKHNYEKLLIGVGAFGVGAGVGVLAK